MNSVTTHYVNINFLVGWISQDLRMNATVCYNVFFITNNGDITNKTLVQVHVVYLYVIECYIKSVKWIQAEDH